MIVYGTYGVLFFAGVTTLVVLSVGRVSESALRIELPQFLFILAALAFVLGVLLSADIALIIISIGFIIVVIVPIAIYLMVKNEITRRAWRKKEEEAEVGKFLKIIEKDPNETVGYIGLARVYERHNRYLKAAEEYGVVGQMFSEDASGYIERLEGKEKLMRRMSAAEEKKKTFVCPHCGGRNRPQQRRCSECTGSLYGSTLRWAWENVSRSSKIGAAAVIVISLLYAIWLPLTYSLTLMAIWLAVIVYFSLPLEAVLSD